VVVGITGKNPTNKGDRKRTRRTRETGKEPDEQGRRVYKTAHGSSAVLCAGPAKRDFRRYRQPEGLFSLKAKIMRRRVYETAHGYEPPIGGGPFLRVVPATPEFFFTRFHASVSLQRNFRASLPDENPTRKYSESEIPDRLLWQRK